MGKSQTKLATLALATLALAATASAKEPSEHATIHGLGILDSQESTSLDTDIGNCYRLGGIPSKEKTGKESASFTCAFKGSTSISVFWRRIGDRAFKVGATLRAPAATCRSWAENAAWFAPRFRARVERGICVVSK